MMLPHQCFDINETNGEVVLLTRGVKGYQSCKVTRHDSLTNPEIADMCNELLGVTPSEREAMLCGSMFGWEVPGADPGVYDYAKTCHEKAKR